MSKEARQGRLWKIAAILGVAFTLLLTSHFVVPEGIFHTLIHEVGFALLVSLVVWGLFEAQLSQETESAWDRRMERVTENVFKAVLRKDLPKELLDEANNLVLNSSLIRRDFTITYTLRDETFAGPTGASECVLVDATVEFEMENVSTDRVEWPVCVGLPNPVHPDLKSRVEVSHVAVTKGGEQLALELVAAEAEFRAALAAATTKVVFKAGTVSLEPGESCRVSASYRMAKEAEDSELLQTLYPADGLRVTIFDSSGPEKRVIFASSVHRKSIEDVSAGNCRPGTQIFKVPGYLLPHQGVLIWWKRNPDAGASISQLVGK